MNSANAYWMSDSFQPVPCWSGCTNSVHAYCRLAIMIIAITDATRWNHRLLMFIALLGCVVADVDALLEPVINHDDRVEAARRLRRGSSRGRRVTLSLTGGLTVNRCRACVGRSALLVHPGPPDAVQSGVITIRL